MLKLGGGGHLASLLVLKLGGGTLGIVAGVKVGGGAHLALLLVLKLRGGGHLASLLVLKWGGGHTWHRCWC